MTQEVDTRMKLRFDGYLPVVVDVETSGVDNRKHGLLEVAAVTVNYNDDGILAPVDSFSTHVTLFEGAVVDPEALKINHIDPGHPFRFAVPESEALESLFSFVSAALKQTGCRRAVLVGHNAHFDLGFIDPQGIIRSLTINDLPIGRSVTEILRTIDALQFHEQHGEVCPANWKKGEEGMKASPAGVADYLKENATSL